ncbi:MAG: hypothetical protein C0414_01050 [Brevundimonas sp.]|nr:hypothetical protein [Brevundimonas sp.]
MGPGVLAAAGLDAADLDTADLDAPGLAFRASPFGAGWDVGVLFFGAWAMNFLRLPGCGGPVRRLALPHEAMMA